MQHIEEAGIHSGDSACVLPPYMMSEESLTEMMDITVRLAKGLSVIGLMNVQFAMKDNVIYVLEVNPRASRTVPFVSKATGVPLAKVAAKVMVGKTLEELGYKNFDFRQVKHISVKEAVFPFAKFPQTPVFLGPEMRSTGEVMGISDNFGASIAKSQIAANNTLPEKGTVFFSVNDNDKTETTLAIARELRAMGFSLIATQGTAAFFNSNGISCDKVFKVNESRPNSVDLIKNGKIQLVINTPLGETSRYDEYSIGWTAIEHKVAFVTTLSAAATAVKAIQKVKEGGLTVKSIQQYLNEIKR
jgi:carbamoyl-phosphate synthase large subunit